MLDILSIFVELNFKLGDMDKIVKFLRERSDIKIGSLERELGLPNATIKLNKGYIIPRHVEDIKAYLIKHYRYEEDMDLEIRNEDNADMSVNTQIVKIYNVGMIPSFKDNKLRFQDDIGRWRRVEDYGCDKDGNVKEDWTNSVGKLFDDEIGGFYIANNGRKIYVNYKQK